MIERWAEILTCKISKMTGEEDKTEIYYYGLQIILNTLVSIFSVISIGIILQKPLYAIFYLFTYCSIRLWAGGYHAKNNTQCIFLFICTFIICAICAEVVNISKNVLISLLIFENIILALLSPVGTLTNLVPINVVKQRKYKTIVSGILVGVIIVAVDNNKMQAYGIFGISWSVFLLLIGKIQMKRGYLYEKKED